MEGKIQLYSEIGLFRTECFEQELMGNIMKRQII